jgi:putative ABC transport system permease protein
MMFGLSAMARKSIADVRRRKLQSVVIILALLFPVAGLTAVSVAGDSLTASYAFSLISAGSKQDVGIAVDHVAPSITREIARQPNVAGAQLLTVLDTQWHVAAAPGHIDLQILGYPNLRKAPVVPVTLESGRYPGPGEIAMEFGDLGLNGFRLGQSITVDTATGREHSELLVSLEPPA